MWYTIAYRTYLIGRSTMSSPRPLLAQRAFPLSRTVKVVCLNYGIPQLPPPLRGCALTMKVLAVLFEYVRQVAYKLMLAVNRGATVRKYLKFPFGKFSSKFIRPSQLGVNTARLEKLIEVWNAHRIFTIFLLGVNKSLILMVSD